jgi:hypothetical protein
MYVYKNSKTQIRANFEDIKVILDAEVSSKFISGSGYLMHPTITFL